MDPVVHFEMPFDDRVRMAKFYKSAFGWKTRMLGEEMGNYVTAATTETGEKGPKKAGKDQRRLLPEKTRLARAISVDRYRR
jgi:hypothetical protein